MRGETGSGDNIDSGIGRAPGTNGKNTTGDGGSTSTSSRTSGTDAGKSR
jgi:hypothetical protein